MRAAMHILLPSDVFPPGSVGGAAWSAHTLARALIERGHSVTAIVPRRGPTGLTHEDALGVPALRWGYAAPSLPVVQNYFRHERLWRPLSDTLIETARAVTRAGAGIPRATKTSAGLLIHAQHVQTIPAAVIAGRRLGVPVVATVRDHWPWDYFATGLHGNRIPYRHTSWASLATDLPARLGPLRGALTLAALPYMLAHLRRRAAFLAQADAVIAVSSYIARRLSSLVPPERLYVLPNMVDIHATERIAATPLQTAISGSFVLFVGKLERNKGAGLLPEIFRALDTDQRRQVGGQPYTLVIAGSGSLQPDIERELAELGVRAQFLVWAPHDEVLRLMANCTVLLFPSEWGEPLSRVLLEAGALGVPIVAMPTGGTPDIISDGVNGALAATAEQFAHRLVRLLANPAERQRLGEAARRSTRERFAVTAVVPRFEALYTQLLCVRDAG